MGMFDTVITTAMNCPLCGQPQNWQTKDGGQSLEHLTVHELLKFKDEVKFYAGCDSCRTWIEVSLKCDSRKESSAQLVQRMVDELMIRRRSTPTEQEKP